MNNEITNPEEIAKDRGIIQNATGGPWIVQKPFIDLQGPSVLNVSGGILLRHTFYGFAQQDAEFIASARTRWPAALDEIDRLRNQIKEQSARLAALEIRACDRCSEKIIRMPEMERR